MMFRRPVRLFGWMFFLMAMSTAALAQTNDTIRLEMIPLAPEVEVGGIALFKVILTNLGEQRDVFKISGDPYDVGPFSKFVQNVKVDPNQVRLDVGESVEARVGVKVFDSAKPDEEFYADIEATSLTHAAVRKKVTLTGYVVPAKEVVQISVSAPTRIMAGDNFDVRVLFKNRLNVPLTNYEVSVYSDLADVSTSFFTDFSAREEREAEFTFPIELSAPVGDYALNVRVYEGSSIKGNYVAAFSVTTKEAVGEESAEKGGFLRSESVIVRVNEGNTKTTQLIKVDSSPLRNIFTSTQPEAEVEDGDLVWEFTLNPGEEYRAVVVRNYRPLFYGFLVVVLAVILIYFYIERSVVIKKRVFMMKSGADGISELKILLIIRNGSTLPLHDVKVMDVLPHIIQPTFEFGTLKASAIQQGTRGKRFVWELGRLEPGEERILMYRVRAKMHLAGGARLPATVMHYMKGDKAGAVMSHRLDIVQQPTEAELMRGSA